MPTTVMISFISNDRPGIVEQLSACVKRFEGNWLHSHMSQFDNQFAGVAQISLASEQLDAFNQALEQLKEEERLLLLSKSYSAPTSHAASVPNNLKTFSVIGLDRPGIVREITQLLAEQHINLVDLKTHIESAPMSGDPLFKALLVISLPESISFSALEDQIEAICSRLDLDYRNVAI